MNPEKITKIELIIQSVFRNLPHAMNKANLFQSGSNTLNFNFAVEPFIPDPDDPWSEENCERSLKAFELCLQMVLNQEGFRNFKVDVGSGNILLLDTSY